MVKKKKKKNEYTITYYLNLIEFAKNNETLGFISIEDLYKYLSATELKLIMKTIINNKLTESMNNYEEIKENDFIKK